MTQLRNSTKRFFDIGMSLLGIVVLTPGALIVAIIVKCTSKGPVLFSQTRIGKNGKPFICYKFRTMATGSERYGSVTAATDMRITAVGKVLRCYKLDEFPQLWNVLIGKMSFVGPRPDVPGYADALSGDERAILRLRPGITGPASLFFRYEEELLAGVDNQQEFNDNKIWPVKVQLNLRYYHTHTFWCDIEYILVTLVPSLNNLFRLYSPSPRTPVELKSTLKDPSLK